jgi:hypothetical protein
VRSYQRRNGMGIIGKVPSYCLNAGWILDHVTTLYQLQQLFSAQLCERVIMFSEREMVGRKVAYFKVLSRHLAGRANNCIVLYSGGLKP